jgi:hypothetical protein
VSFSPTSRNAFPSRRQISLSGRRSFSLFAGSKKNLSASEQERRDEENRRRTRKDDVIIGKTSAKKGEKDFSLNPKATEEQWLRQASKIEQKIFRLTATGMEALNSVCRLERENGTFVCVFDRPPSNFKFVFAAATT